MGDRTCSVDGCDKPIRVESRKLCGMHYERWRKHGDPLLVRRSGKPPRDVAERFWEKVDASGVCWEWTAADDGDGYGQFRPGPGLKATAYRWAYEYLIGPVPTGLELDHRCRNRRCVDPAHLEPVTTRVNNLRGGGHAAVNARKTRCKRGHEFTAENTYLRGREGNGRECRICRRLGTAAIAGARSK